MTTWDDSMDGTRQAAVDAARAAGAIRDTAVTVATAAAVAAVEEGIGDAVSTQLTDTGSAAYAALVSAAGTVTDPQVASAVSGAGPTRAALGTLLGGDTSTLIPDRTGLPVAAERHVYVSVRGNDSKDGRSWRTAKLTLAGALTELGGNPGVIELGVGTLTTSATHTLPGGTWIKGSGRELGASMLNYTGTGTLLQGTSGTRTYNQRIDNVLFNGPGKATTAVAVDVVDMSMFAMNGCMIGSFGIGIKHRSAVLGGSVYNDFADMLVNNCGTGVQFRALGSNASRWRGVGFGGDDIGVDILDSNQNNFHACTFEVNTTAIKIDATSAGTSDHNSFDHCRFELNTVPWNIVSANVRDTEITWPAIFDTWTAPVDNGTRTRVLASYGLLAPPGTQRYVLLQTGNYTLNAGDDIILMNAASVTATLPTAASAQAGRIYTVKNLHSSTCTVATAGGTIDGASTKTLAQYAALRLVSDGSNWLVV